MTTTSPLVPAKGGFVMATRNVLIALASAAVIAGAAGCGTSSTPRQTTSTIATPTTSAHGPAATPSGYGPQSVLPFTDLSHPYELAVDAAGNLYVTDNGGNGRVLMLAAGSNAPTLVPFTRLPELAADTAGTVYVIDDRNDRLVKLAAGSNTQTVLPWTMFDGEVAAVDTAGNIYGTRGGGEYPGGGCCKPVQLVELAHGSSAWSVLLTEYVDLTALTVDSSGAVYVVEGSKQVVKLPAGASAPTPLPFPDLKFAGGVAVDTAGNLYVADYEGNRVFKLAPGATSPTVLPFTGLNHPTGVAVDTAGTVFVGDSGNHRVVKLAVG